ncbi:MAG: sulfurtransferase TusA family protein [Thermoleophilia bacterium]|nr:sulfurtransferase TusA family protein [Thermoleophilia bacterium]
MTGRADRVVDALGTWCPVPVTMAQRATREMRPGQVLHVLADDPMVFLDLPAWCHDQGHEVLQMDQERHIIRTRIRVG